VDGLVGGRWGGLFGAIGIDLQPYWTLTVPPLLVLRWDAIAAGITVIVAILLAAWSSRTGDSFGALRPLRRDDLVYIVVGILPGAAIGGRLLHGLAYLDTYAADPAALFDPARGTLSMLGAVLGGSLSGILVARVLGTPWRRWLDVAAPILLLTIAGGKIAQFLGGGGQGIPWDGPWAVAFLGDGPWSSVWPFVPAHPAQLYEALWALAGLLPLSWVNAFEGAIRLPVGFRQEEGWLRVRQDRGEDVTFGRLRFGLLYLFALGWWLVGRFVIAFTWRDDLSVGPLRAEQAMALAALLAVAVLMVAATRMTPERTAGVSRPGDIDWPEEGARVDLPVPDTSPTRPIPK
jgi:phosphatidylglycerol:prolipoprotein diacylglycerol transferase